MSGIVGVLRRDGAKSFAGDLDGALAVMSRRGPHGQNAWCSGPVGLGCAHLRATPQSVRETLPLEDGGQGLTIVHDARIDERSETLRSLGLEGPPAAVSDADLLLAAWRRWGEAMVEHLLGDFAFAIWDERRQELFLARDHTGMRMLFVHESPSLFAFASEAQALAAVPGVPRRLELARVTDYMLGVVCDPALTFHAGIRRVAPAHALCVSAAASRTRRYWALSLPESVHGGSPGDVAAGFRAVLAESVRDRLVTTGKAGSMLSGGLDSSAIVCVARSLRRAEGGEALPTFSLVFPRTPGADESAFIRALVDQGDLEPHYIDADALSPLRDIEDMLAATGEPFHGAPFAYQWATYRAARGAGVDVLLDGNGGDAVVCHGYFFLANLLRAGRLARLAREAAGLSRAYDLTPAQSIWRFAVLPSIPPALRRLRRAVIGRAPELPASTFIAPGLAECTRVHERFTEFWHRQPPPRGDREYHLANVAESLPKDGLEHAASAFAVDQRCPFYDVRVIEYCLAVPSPQKIENGLTRMLTRRALRDDLPPLVARRPGKATPTLSLVRGLFGPDREKLDRIVFDPAADRFSDLLDLASLRATTRLLEGRFDAAGPAMPSVAGWHEIDQVRKAAVLLQWLHSARLAD